MDGAWINRGTGNLYKSAIGHQIVIGTQTGKVIALNVLSKVCSKCEAGTEHEEALCPKNYNGSSKGMEASGALENVQNLFENNKCYCHTIVMNDNSSTKSILQHSLEEKKIQSEKEGLTFEWPKEGNKKVKNIGHLPIAHPEPLFLADLNY